MVFSIRLAQGKAAIFRPSAESGNFFATHFSYNADRRRDTARLIDYVNQL